MIEGSVILSLSLSFLLPSCEEIPPEALPASDTISSPKSDMPAGEPSISKGTVEHSSNCEVLPQDIYTTFFPFGSRFHRQNLPIPKHSSVIYALTFVLKRTSRKTHPFVNQSINNFSGYDISQSHDWECPFLSLHFLLDLEFSGIAKKIFSIKK